MKPWLERKSFRRVCFSVCVVCALGIGACAKVAKQLPEPIVYNADISPQYARDKSAPNRAMLAAGKVTTLEFDIGPRRKSSVLRDVVPSDDILKSKEDVPLTVVLVCGFCEPHAESLKRMTYRPSQRRSNEIGFQFTPQRREDGSGYVDKLQLEIINDATGREYNRIVIDVAVSSISTDQSPVDSTIAVDISRGQVGGDWSPDVILYAVEEMGRTISISVEPVSDEIKRRLNLALDAAGERRTFRSGIDDAKLVEAMTSSAYGVMSAVSNQGQFLKRLSAGGTDAAVSSQSQKSLQLTDEELKKVTSVIADIGQRLYRRLFVEAPDADLRTLIVELEKAAADPKRARPLRLKIVTNKISLPWQYLHPVGPDVDSEKFWGLRFSLSVLRANTGARVKPIAPPQQQARKVLFARYGSSADETWRLANEQKQQLSKLPIAASDLVEVDSGSELLNNLAKRRKEISAIFAFLHATSMSPDSEPYLSFNDGDVVTSDVLERLLNKVPMNEQDSRYLATAPLVILNACETGPSVNLPHVSLQNVMFQLGAQGVVVTEVSVWIQLGHEMATRLIKRLGKGEPIGDALTAIRRELYAEKNNPLGLLYVYYGDPAAKLQY
jgi:hypothetical protein